MMFTLMLVVPPLSSLLQRLRFDDFAR